MELVLFSAISPVVPSSVSVSNPASTFILIVSRRFSLASFLHNWPSRITRCVVSQQGGDAIAFRSGVCTFSPCTACWSSQERYQAAIANNPADVLKPNTEGLDCSNNRNSKTLWPARSVAHASWTVKSKPDNFQTSVPHGHVNITCLISSGPDLQTGHCPLTLIWWVASIARHGREPRVAL
jgi:hypothetical protein